MLEERKKKKKTYTKIICFWNKPSWQTSLIWLLDTTVCVHLCVWMVVWKNPSDVTVTKFFCWVFLQHTLIPLFKDNKYSGFRTYGEVSFCAHVCCWRVCLNCHFQLSSEMFYGVEALTETLTVLSWSHSSIVLLALCFGLLC